MEPFVPLGDLLMKQFPEQSWVVDRLVPASAITILSGYPNSYKTYTLLQTAISVAKGDPLFGHFKTEQTGVLVMDLEDNDWLLQKRLLQLQATANLPVYLAPSKDFVLNEENMDDLMLNCKAQGIGLLIIDPLIRIHGSNENSAVEMSEVFKHLRRLTDIGVSVLLTHHNRKPGVIRSGVGNEMRGSSDILASVDSHIGITRKDKWYLTFDQTKQRYALELDPFEVKVSADEETFSFEFLGSVKPQASSAEMLREAIDELLAESDKLMQKDLLAGLAERGVKTNEHALRGLLRRCVAEGAIVESSGVGNTKFYSLGKEVDNA